MATQLGVWNTALINIGERRLASTSEAREPRYALDDVYASVKQYCLEQGIWSFALRGASAAQSGSTAYGRTYRVPKPSDLVHTFTLGTAADFSSPLKADAFVDEAGYWYADAATLYVRYVSNDASYGGNLSLWTQTFADYVSAVLSRSICYRLTGSEGLFRMMLMLERDRLDTARSVDTLMFPPGMEPFNRWARDKGHNSEERQGERRQR